jgi:predicted negative regulator of RcsB-dependent stress response
MVEHFASDDEQVETLKRWWKENGTGILVGIGIGVAGILGWQYWNGYVAGQAEQASLHYDALREALRGEDTAKAREQAEILMDAYESASYATLAALMLARLAVEGGDNAAAAEHLEWAVERADQAEIKVIARLRLARVLLADGKLDEAQAQLTLVDSPSFAAEIEELKGDIHVARNEPGKARAAYEAARIAGGLSGADRMLQLKLENLPPAPSEDG